MDTNCDLRVEIDSHRVKVAVEEIRIPGQPSDRPSGVTTIDDLRAAETRLAVAQAELNAYQESDGGLRESLSREGERGFIVERHRAERIEFLRTKVERARLGLQQTKRDYFSGIREEQ